MKIKCFDKKHTVTLGTTWKRYSFTGKIPAKAPWYYTFYIGPGKGVYWADAMQLEKGNIATEYQP